MPVVILGTQMERGPVRWSVVTSGLEGVGPADKTLVIKFQGNPAELAGFNGNELNIADFRQNCSLAKQDWIPEEGVFRCSLSVGMPPYITVSFK